MEQDWKLNIVRLKEFNTKDELLASIKVHMGFASGPGIFSLYPYPPSTYLSMATKEGYTYK